MKKFELVEHTADMGLKVYGRSREELFENGAAVLFSLMTDTRHVRHKKTLHLELKSSSVEELFVDWLSELLYRSEVEEMLFSAFKVEWVGECGLKARIGGDTIAPDRHRLKREVKAVTRHALHVGKKKGKKNRGWEALVIFDV